MLTKFLKIFKYQLGKLAREVVMSDEVRSAYEEKIVEGLHLLSSEHNCPVTKGAFIDVIVEISSRCDSFKDETITASLKSLLPTVLQCKGKELLKRCALIYF
jgi:hypothetical protein